MIYFCCVWLRALMRRRACCMHAVARIILEFLNPTTLKRLSLPRAHVDVSLSILFGCGGYMAQCFEQICRWKPTCCTQLRICGTCRTFGRCPALKPCRLVLNTKNGRSHFCQGLAISQHLKIISDLFVKALEELFLRSRLDGIYGLNFCCNDCCCWCSMFMRCKRWSFNIERKDYHNHFPANTIGFARPSGYCKKFFDENEGTGI